MNRNMKQWRAASDDQHLKMGKCDMEWMQEMLRAVPGASKYRLELERLAADNGRLERENGELKEELAQYIEQWETLDGEAVRTLRYLAAAAFDSAEAIANA